MCDGEMGVEFQTKSRINLPIYFKWEHSPSDKIWNCAALEKLKLLITDVGGVLICTC